MLVHVSAFYCRVFSEHCVQVGLWDTVVGHLLTGPEVSTYVTFVLWNFYYKLSSIKVVVDSSSSFDVLCWATEVCTGRLRLTALRLESKSGALQASDPDQQEFPGEKWGTKEWKTPSKKPTTQTPSKQKACCGHHCEYSS